MKLWLLRPVEFIDDKENPWEPSYDKALGFVVRAETEHDARELANSKAGEENMCWFLSSKTVTAKHPWKDAKYSTCTELLPYGDAGIVICDFG